MPAIAQPSNVAREPVQGEVGVMEAQQAAAPLSPPSQPSGPPIEERPIDQPVQPEAAPVEEEPVNPGNLLRVLPPEPTTPQPPLSAAENLGYTILGLEGASPIARRLASQLVGNLERGGRMRLKPGPLRLKPAPYESAEQIMQLKPKETLEENRGS